MVINGSLVDIAVGATFTAHPARAMTRPQPPVGFRTQPLKGGQGGVGCHTSSNKVAAHIHRGVFGRQGVHHEPTIVLGLRRVTAH